MDADVIVVGGAVAGGRWRMHWAAWACRRSCWKRSPARSTALAATIFTRPHFACWTNGACWQRFTPTERCRSLS